MDKLKLYAFADEASAAVDGQVSAMLRNGLNGLEIRNVNGANVSDMTPKHAREVKKKLDDAGLTVWSVGSPVGKIGIEEDFTAHLDKFKWTLDVAHLLGAENIRLFSFYIPEEHEPARFRDQVMDRMGALVDASKDSGVTLCHENEKLIYGDVAERCAELHRAFPTLRAVFDPANFIQCGQETWQAWLLLKPWVKYLHIKDALPDGSVVPAGKGIGHVGEILKDYIANGGRVLTLEPHLKVFDGFAALEREGSGSSVGQYCYASNDEAFDAACTALKTLLEEVSA